MLKNIYKTFIIILALVFLGQAQVYAISETPSDYTGDSFWQTPIINDKGDFVAEEDENIDVDDSDFFEQRENKKNNNPSKAIPPVKLIRLKAKAYLIEREKEKAQKLETKSQKIKKNKIKEKTKKEFEYEDDEEEPTIEETETQPDVSDVDSDIDADNIKAKEHRQKKQELAEQTQITIDCKYMDYQAETGYMLARDNVLITFPHGGTTLSADIVTFDKNTGKMHAEGNIVIDKSGSKTYGEFIDIDLNEESIFIAKPITQNTQIKIRAEQGFVQRDMIVNEKGSIEVEDNMPLSFRTSGGPDARYYMRSMYIPEEEKFKLTKGKSKIFKIQAEEIIINSEEYLDVLKLKKAKITAGDKTVLKIPKVTIYSDKGHSFVEGNYPEIGSRRNLGLFVGPGFVIKLPKSSLLKVIPAINYKKRIGIAGVVRYWNPTNFTQIGYGTAKSKVVIRGEQKLDDNLNLIYASNDFLDNWFLGRRMPKYGADVVYKKLYTTNSLLPKDTWFGEKLPTSYEHRISAGYFQDMTSGGDSYYDSLHGNDIGTMRFRYMARLSQSLYDYKSEDKLFRANVRMNFEGSSAIYGTGDTQMVGRVGPNLHLQYKRWMQDIGYLHSAYHDETPLPVFDKYRYGRSQVYLREYIRLCRFLTIGWHGSVTLSDDTYTKKKFQECSFYASIGPDDLKVNIGYDWVRENAFINLVLAMDTKGTKIDYDKMVIKNPENFNKMRKRNEAIYRAAQVSADGKTKAAKGVLTKAVVEDLKEDFDDI